MKKLLSIALAAGLMLSCSMGTFSADTTTASPDEAKELVSIEFSQLPSKTDYFLFEDAGWNIDIDEDETDWDVIEEAIMNAPFYIDVDLSDAVILGTYSDGSVAEIDPELCTTSLSESMILGDLLEIEDEEAIYSMICREFTIIVEYENVSTSFKVNVDYIEEPYYSEVYEFVSYTPPAKTTYVIDDDFVVDAYLDEDDNENFIKYLDFDLTGMTVTIRNIDTGELITYDEDSIYVDFYVDYEEAIAAGDYIAEGTVITDDGEFIPFDFEFTLVDSKNTSEENNNSVDESKNNQTATSTSDTANKTTSDNNAVQTGSASFAGIFFVLIISATAFTFVLYRRKTQ